MTTYDARRLATGWLSTFIASAPAKEDRVQLARTVCVEEFPTGVRLISTDSYILLRSWVPIEAFDPEPELDEAPLAVATCADLDGRGAGLLRYALQLTSGSGEDERVPLDANLRLNLKRPDDASETATFEGMERIYAVIELPDTERVWLPLIEGEFPNWRSIALTFKGKTTQAIALNPELLGRLGKLSTLHPGQPLDWYFGGPDKVARLHLETPGDVVVNGLIMPVRTMLIPEEEEPEADARQRPGAVT